MYFLGEKLSLQALQFTFTYIKGTTEPIKRVLSNYNIKVAQKPHQTIGNLFPKPKDPVPKDQTRGTIYSIPCKDYDKSYIGETKRKFSTRLKEHQKTVEQKVNTRASQLKRNIVYVLATPSPGRRLKFYAQVRIGVTDAFLKHGKSTLAGIP